MSIHIHIHNKVKDAEANLGMIKKRIEQLLKSRSDVRSVGSWAGKELKVTTEDLDTVYVSFEVNDAATRYRLKTQMGLSNLNGKVFDI